MINYPTEEELDYIKNYNILENDIIDLIEFIRSIWWPSGWGFKLSGKNVLKLELHTGGWSGNEDIIYALKQTKLFWVACWVKSVRGGHYYFEIRLKMFEKK